MRNAGRAVGEEQGRLASSSGISSDYKAGQGIFAWRGPFQPPPRGQPKSPMPIFMDPQIGSLG